MKVTRFMPKAIWVLIGLMTVAGCGQRPGPMGESEQVVPVVPQFSAKRGLLLPEETKQALGMKTVEVAEREMASFIEVVLRVYEESGGRVLASGNIEPDQGKQLAQGRSVEVIAGSRLLAGKILHVYQETRAATGFDEVLVEIPNGRELLSVGSFVSARVQLEPKEGAVVIPRGALLACTEGRFVYTVSGDHLVRTAVKVGASDKEWVEVTDGLYAGDQVVAEPVMSLWLTELAAVKGGQACCAAPPKGK